MGSLREIKDRIGSVKSTLKITSAMKLVASSKLRRSQKAIEAMLPYKNALESILDTVSAGMPAPAPAPVPEPDQFGFEQQKAPEIRTAVVAISSNSSLCGGFNVNVVRKALQVAADYGNADIIAVGRKMHDAARKAGFPQDKDWSDVIGKPSYASSASLAEFLTDSFEKGKYGRVVLVYNHFVSTSRQEPVEEQYLPLAGTSPSAALSDDFKDYILEPSAEEIIAELLPQVQKLKIYTAVLDSAASEHAARTIAMQTASDNAEEILSDLTLEYNKGRQQKITAEILDLVGGMAK